MANRLQALLGTKQLPAHSCRQIAELRRDVGNGVYHIKSVGNE